MNNLRDLGLIPVLNDLVQVKKVPILGICLGVQLMTRQSDEGTQLGLSWFDAKTIEFDKNNLPNELKIPHMGWSEVFVKKNDILFNNPKMFELFKFYHVHSYHLDAINMDQVLAVSKYGDYEFVTALKKNNIYGVQFHPEKSHKYGKQIFENFLNLDYDKC